jgi:hypothetical protein
VSCVAYEGLPKELSQSIQGSRANQRHSLPPHMSTSSMTLLLVGVAIRGSIGGRAVTIIVVGAIVAIAVVVRAI